MEIELTTTNKKLTLAIIKQMLPADLTDLGMIMLYPERVLGYVVVKGEKIALVRGVTDWKQLNISHDWVAAKHSDIEVVSSKRFIRFESTEDRTIFLERYARLRELAVNHIYI